MATDEFGGIIQSGAPAGQQQRDEFGGIIQGGNSLPPPGPLASSPTVDQRFQADPVTQSAADHYVQDKWRQYGAIAGQSQGQSIRDYAKATFGTSADRSAIPALDYRPEHDPIINTSYVRNSLPPDRQAQLEAGWRAEFLHGALGQAVGQQTEAARPVADAGPDAGIIHGQIDRLIKGGTDLVVPQVKGGTDLFYGLRGGMDPNEGLYGATANATPNELDSAATDKWLGDIQANIDRAYPKSSAARNNPGGIADTAENVTEMLPMLAAGAGAFKAGGVQKALALSQIAAGSFQHAYDSTYEAGLRQGLSHADANQNALIGGSAEAAANTYLMKFGVLGNEANAAQPFLRRALTLALTDAVAQGGVGAGQALVGEATKYAATGEPGSVDNILHAAIQSAVAGGVFGAGRAVIEGGSAKQPVAVPEHTNSPVLSADPAAVSPAREPTKAGVNVPAPDPALLKIATINPESPNAPVLPVAGESPAAVAEPAKAAGPAEPPATPLLDKAGAKHRVHNADGTSTARPVEFENPTDKALYAATAERQGKVGAEAKTFLAAQGMTPDDIAERGAAVRGRVKGLADAQPGTEPIKVPHEQATVRPEPVVDTAKGGSEPVVQGGEAGRPGGEAVVERPAGSEGADAGRAAVHPDATPEALKALVGELYAKRPEGRYGVDMADMRKAVAERFGPEAAGEPLDKALKAMHGDQSLRLVEPGDLSRYTREQRDAAVPGGGPNGFVEVHPGDSVDQTDAKFLPEKSAKGRDQRDELLAQAMPKAYVVKKGITGGHAEVLAIHKELTGQEAIPYAGGRARGFRKDGRTFYSVERNETPYKQKEAIVHEATHWLQDNRPELAAEIADAIPPDTRAKLLAEYEHNYRTQEGKALDPAMRDKEVEALAVGRAFTKVGVARQVMETARGPFTRALDAVVTKLRGLTAGGRLTNQVVETLRQLRQETAAERRPVGLKDLAPDHPIRRELDGLQAENEKLRAVRDRARAAVAAAKGGEPDNFLPGGVDKFAKDDVIDRAKDVWDGVRRAWDGVKRLVAPQSRGPEAKVTAERMREAGAELSQRWDRLGAALDKTEAAMDKLPVADTRGFIDATEYGVRQPDAALQPVADAVRTLLDDRLAQVQALGTGKLAAFIENYFPHIWDDPKKAADVFKGLASKRPWEGNKSFLKQRTHALFADGIAAGLKPVSENPVTLLKLRLRAMDQYIVAHQAFNELRAKGIMRKIPARLVGQMKANGYAQINDSIATIYAPPNRKGGVSIAGYWMAPEPAATVVNNYLSPGLRSDPHFGGLFRGYLGAGNLMNQAQLGLSAFHATFVTFDAAVGRMALGIEEAAKGNWKEAGKAAGSAATLVGPGIQNFRTGSLLMNEWLRPGSSGRPDVAAVVDAMKAGGGRIGVDNFHQTGMVDAMKKAWRQGNILGAAFRAPFAAVEAAAHPILGELVPRMKMGAFFDIVSRELTPGMTRDQIRETAGKAWDSVDNRLGEMVYDNLFWHKAVKDLSMASVRAVGWNLGTFRELGGGTADIGKALARAATGRRPELTHRMAYTLALPLLTGLVGGVTHYAMTGKRPDELKDWFFPQTGQLDKEGHAVRVQMPGYMADVFKYGHDIRTAVAREQPLLALETLRHKTHPMLNTMMEMLANKDYYGQKIRNEDDPFVRQLIDTAEHAGKAFVPFGVRDAAKLADEGQGAKSLLPLAGIVRARSDITHTDAELKAEQMIRDGAPAGSRTREQVQHGKQVRDLADSLHQNEPDARDRIRQGVADGSLTQEDVQRIQQDQKMPTLLDRQVRQLDAEQAFKVWDVATPDERKRIGPALIAKLRSSKALPPARRADLIRRFQADWAALKAPPPAGEGE